MPPRKNPIDASREHLGTAGGDHPLVDDQDPAALPGALDKLGAAVTANQQAENGTADAEGQHRSAVDGMNNITEQMEISTGEMVYDVRDFLIEQIKARPKPWSSTSQAEQRDVAAAAEHAAKEVVRKIVEAVAARGASPVRVLLTKVTLGSDMVIAGKVKTFSPEEENAAVDTLHKAIGKHVLLTVASTDDFTGGGREAETDADELPLNFEAGVDQDDDDTED
ncbi:MAG: hypothetical protein WKF79_00070 [Nocardioides sp.]